MFDKNSDFVSQNFQAYAMFNQNPKFFENPCVDILKAKGIHIGFEVESIKAPHAKILHTNDDSADEEVKSTITASTVQSTPKGDRHSERKSVSQEKPLLGKRKKFPLLEGCNDIENYTLLNYIHEGVYGTVFRAQDKFTGTIQAIKKVKLHYEKEGFPVTALREINLLKTIRHPNIINLNEVVMSKSLDQIFLVTEYAEHELRDLIQNYNYQFSIAEIKSLMKQLLQAMAYLHSKDIVHRDLKTSNILYTQKGLLKVCDFGLSRKIMGSNQSYTPTVVTLTYRAPEVLLGCDRYTSAIDMWSVGCIFAELLQGEPLFRAKSEMELVDLIFRTLGTPTTTNWPGWKELKFSHFFEGHNSTVNTLCNVFAGFAFGKEEDMISDSGMDLLEQLLVYDPSKRITAGEALKHPWFAEEPLPKDPKQMPVFPATNELPRQLGKRVFVNN